LYGRRHLRDFNVGLGSGNNLSYTIFCNEREGYVRSISEETLFSGDVGNQTGVLDEVCP
jgi:hypothetical protein